MSDRLRATASHKAPASTADRAAKTSRGSPDGAPGADPTSLRRLPTRTARGNPHDQVSRPRGAKPTNPASATRTPRRLVCWGNKAPEPPTAAQRAAKRRAAAPRARTPAHGVSRRGPSATLAAAHPAEAKASARGTLPTASPALKGPLKETLPNSPKLLAC